MEQRSSYDVAIVGGGLAGLSLSIQLARWNHRVILFEKEEYPFHKVCGEYISLESWDFLNDLGVPLDQLEVPIITKLEITSANGHALHHPLPLGGFGISRFLLDDTLAKLAGRAGVTIKQNCKVNDLSFSNDQFTLDTSEGIYQSKAACCTYGKRSNIDIKKKRPFSTAQKNKLNNYIGVKYHVTGDFPADTIALHNFKDGYCGLVKIEGEQYNLCYLTTADNLQKSNGNIATMEQTILSRNPVLRQILQDAKKINGPLTISQISFDKKSQVEDHLLMIGDAAGMITPLCGNGMSMALHGSKIAALHIHHFLQGKIDRQKMEDRYIRQWKKNFASRLRIGRQIQSMFGSALLTNMMIGFLKRFPGMVTSLVRKTHGKPF